MKIDLSTRILYILKIRRTWIPQSQLYKDAETTYYTCVAELNKLFKEGKVMKMTKGLAKANTYWRTK